MKVVVEAKAQVRHAQKLCCILAPDLGDAVHDCEVVEEYYKSSIDAMQQKSTSAPILLLATRKIAQGTMPKAGKPATQKLNLI